MLSIILRTVRYTLFAALALIGVAGLTCIAINLASEYFNGLLPECGPTDYVYGSKTWYYGERTHFVKAAEGLFWRTVQRAHLCKVSPTIPWFLYVTYTGVCFATGYVVKTCIQVGPFKALLHFTTKNHPLKDSRRVTMAVKCPKPTNTNPTNKHAGGASLRLQYHKWIHAICASFPGIAAAPQVVRFDLSISARDAMFGTTVIGRRRLITKTDMSVDRTKQDDFIKNLPVSAVDTAHYLKPREWDEFAGSPIVFNCIIARAVAWKTEWSTAYLGEGSVLTEVVDGGDTYTHRLVDPTQHQFYLYGWTRTYLYEQQTLNVPDSNQAVFVWTPIAVTCLPFYIFIPLYWLSFFEFPARPGFWKGVTKSTTQVKNSLRKVICYCVALPAKLFGDVVSTREETWINGECSTIDRKSLDVITLRAVINGSATNVYDASSVLTKAGELSTPETATMAAIVSQPGQLPTLTTPVGFVPVSGGAVETHGMPVPVAEIVPCGSSFPARVAADSDEVVVAQLKRADKLQKLTPIWEGLPDVLQNAIDVALTQLKVFVGPVDPWSLEQVIASQKRPAQKARNERMLASESNGASKVDAKPCAKKEAEVKPNGRIIVPCDAEFGVELGRYSKPIYETFKTFSCFGAGRTGQRGAELVRHTASSGRVYCTDASDADKSHGPVTRTKIYERIMLEAFNNHPGLANLLGKLRNVKLADRLKTFKMLTDGMNISGMADTTILNTFVLIVFALAAQHLAGVDVDVETCGVYSGDDGVVPERIYEQFMNVSKACGFTIKTDVLRDEHMVKFLNRIYQDPTVSLTSVPDVSRFVNKFGVFTTASASVAERVSGTRVSDPHNPFLVVYCNAMLSCDSSRKKDIDKLKRMPTKELAMKLEVGAFPFDKNDKDAAIDIICWSLECTRQKLDDWMASAKKVKSQQDWDALPLLIEGEEKVGKLPTEPVPYPKKD